MTTPRFIPSLLAAITLVAPALAQPTTPAPAPVARPDYTAALNAIPTRDSLLAYHQLLASEPHIAGTDGDKRQIERLEKAFREMGLEVERHEIWPLLCRPVAAHVEIVEPERIALDTRESTLGSDPFSALPTQTPGWNAYSASGDVTAPVVYANYGRKEDYARLKELGVDLTGKIVICRYGGNFRGYKHKFAEAAGAAGVIIYTDPADSGYAKGIAWPEGTWSNSTCIERGSLDTLPYPGDPLTPGIEATKDAKRLDPDTIGLPRIPVQPIGYGAAAEILKRFEGPGVPEGWQGGLPFAYRVSGPASLKVRLHVEQVREVMQTANVIARLRGTEEPEKLMIIGCHHDAWGCGAADPTCGTIALMESARSFAKLAAEGRRPRRTVIFAAWGAEEFGILGSTEWVEAHEADLVKNAVGYINLDMASMGPDFGASTSPSLRWLVMDCAKHVPAARDPGKTVFEAWLARGEDPLLSGWPKFGDMGGGSDHIAFLCRTAIASTSLGGSGGKGNAYHSVYDTLPWYWKAVGSDYESPLMVTRMTNAVAARMADDALLPLDPARYALETRRQLADIRKKAAERGLLPTSEPDLPDAWKRLEERGARLQDAAQDFDPARGRLRPMTSDVGARKAITEGLLATERVWLDERGLPGRPWFRNLWAASDEDSGYAAWTMPLFRRALEQKDAAAFEAATAEYTQRLGRVLESLAATGRATHETVSTPQGR